MIDSPKPIKPRWEPRNNTEYDSVGIVTSKVFRQRKNSNGNPIWLEFLERHKDLFREKFLFVTWGSYLETFLKKEIAAPLESPSRSEPLAASQSRKCRWESEYDWLPQGYCLRPGKRGGILEMAEHLEESAGKDRIKTLIFLADPDDLEESYPEDGALFRSAIRNNVVYLSTLQSTELWALAETAAKRRPANNKGEGNPEDETLALIAHDGKKLELCRWVVEHRQRIRRFKKLITTGTTGEKVSAFLKATGVPDRKIELIDRMASGPKGGDVEIGGDILRGNCQHVVFFVDPMTSHPHEADIQALLRICSMADVKVNLRLTEMSANNWITTIDPMMNSSRS